MSSSVEGQEPPGDEMSGGTAEVSAATQFADHSIIGSLGFPRQPRTHTETEPGDDRAQCGQFGMEEPQLGVGRANLTSEGGLAACFSHSECSSLSAKNS